jgi:F-type H+-transporting ATPase subunit b
MLHDPEFWVAVAFLLVVAVVFRPAAKAITSTLDDRAAKIRVQIEEARKLREDAQALLAEYQRKQRDAMAEAEKIISNARAEAARLKVDAEKDLEHTIERRKQQALERIAQTEAQAIASVRNTAVDVALAAAEKLIKSSLDAGKQQALADKAIGELGSRLN